MNRLVPWALAAVTGFTALAVGVGWFLRPDRADYEEPAYTVHASYSSFQVRDYEPTLEAQVTVSGSREQATREGFQMLAGYIFGGNQAKESIAMTAGVSASPESQSIEMTTPVSATPAAAGWTVAFTMPRKWTLATLPVPNDPRVKLVEVAGHRAAVRTFSGRANQGSVESEELALMADLETEGLAPGGPAVVAQFDPPWVLGPWRRNEVQVGLVE